MVQAKVRPTARLPAARAVRVVLLSMLVALSASVAMSAWARPGGHGMGGAGMMFGGSPERMARGIDHMLDGLNATDAQRSQIKQIALAAATDLKAQREVGRALREKAAQVFTAPNVDAATAESVRQQMLAHHDQRSRRMMQAMLEASQVLTAEQRVKLGERMKQRNAQRQERRQRLERHGQSR